MLSRRNIRIKVLQSLYMLNRDPSLTQEQTIDFYNDLLSKSRKLYLFTLYSLIQTASYAAEDYEKKKTKYLPSELDKKFTDKLYTNDLIQVLEQNKDLQKEFDKEHIRILIDRDIFQKIYKKYARTEEYKEYSTQPTVNAHHMVIILDLFKHMIKSENYEEVLDDHFPTWSDDKSLIIGAMKKTIKMLPDHPDMYKTIRPDHEAAIEFGEKLLEQTIERSDAFNEIIEPALKNWDMDRVANIDNLLLKMAICEFTVFPSIPTKVTINEYVEIAKSYSTDKSKDFINGMLDRLMKEMMEEGKINKSGRGLVDE